MFRHEFQERFKEESNKKNTLCKPWGKAAAEWGGGTALKEALENGECTEIVEDGIRKITWKEGKIATADIHRSGMKLDAEAKITKDAYKAIQNLLGKIGWNPELSQKQVADLDTKAEVPEQLVSKLNLTIKSISKSMADATITFKDVSVKVAIKDSTNVNTNLKLQITVKERAGKGVGDSQIYVLLVAEGF